ncbi:MAG: RHS repeat-associated core domain-containing protein [Bacteroides sp.]|nr:RHS repeat-associated core domain-containing protein [Bacteroides sp.]
MKRIILFLLISLGCLTLHAQESSVNHISTRTFLGSNGLSYLNGIVYYDGLDRLLNATYGETASITANANRFSENVTAYDKNGNIQSLQRYGQTGASAYGLIDNLTFTLSGNRLTRVDDAVTAAAYSGGFEFKDAVKQANEYAYDSNGNFTKDLNKNITGIQYNCLNLPDKVTFSDGSTITYTYTADGTKLKTVHKIGGTTTTTDYCGNVVYENGVQKLLLTEAGYVTLSDSKYHYCLQDHQGNNRVVINQSGTVEETNHYYPFGGMFASSASAQPYKYNGKELDAKKGLNWYDYGARHYDAAVGRFVTVDPLTEKYYQMNPYAYCLNNSIKYVDTDGERPRIYVETKGFGHVFVTTGSGQNTTVYTYGRYGDVTWNKSSSVSSARNGEGVLIVMKGKEALRYIKNEITKMEARVYEVSSGSDEKVDKHFGNMFASSDKKPSKKSYSNAENASVIDKYDLLDNNCTTKSLEAISVGTDGEFDIESTSPSNLDTKLYYENKKDDSRIRKVTYDELYEEYFK